MHNVINTHNQQHLLTPKNPRYRRAIYRYTTEAFLEDVGKGDITTNLLFQEKKTVHGRIIAKESGICAGQQEIEYFLVIGKFEVAFFKKDGGHLKKGDCICEIKADIRDILRIERTILNLLGRMSGIATLTHRIVKKARRVNPNLLLCPTRKTLWGFLDKRAVAIGGGGTHRLGLDDAILIKDNHLDAAGRNIAFAISRFFPVRSAHKFIEIEVEDVEEALIAIREFVRLRKKYRTRIPCFVMLDNVKPDELKRTLILLEENGLRNEAGVEVSGGITEKNIVSYAKTGVDIISMGCLTHSAAMLDVSLELLPYQM